VSRARPSAPRAARHISGSAHVLLLDIGNSRLKWALLREPYRRGQRFRARGTLDLARLGGSGAALQRLFARLTPLSGIEVCNVAGVRMRRHILGAAHRARAPRPHFARSAHAAGGVRNAYPQPWRLGVDRWAAMIGAHHEHPGRALCVVAVGTAMTIDLIDAHGRHQGGNIIPSPRLMIESLLERTAGIRRRAGGRSAAAALRARRVPLFARDTRRAVTAGAAHAAAALIGEAVRAARAPLGRTPRLLLSGGGADAIAPLLDFPYRREHELALRGLAVLRSERLQIA